MSLRPAITISTTDFNRLGALLARHPDSEVADGLLEELDRATLVEPTRLPATVVAMNARLRFRIPATGQEHTVELLYPHEVQGLPGQLSILTPAGAALLGLAVGDCIDWPVADWRTLRLELVEVLEPGTAPAA